MEIYKSKMAQLPTKKVFEKKYTMKFLTAKLQYTTLEEN